MYLPIQISVIWLLDGEELAIKLKFKVHKIINYQLRLQKIYLLDVMIKIKMQQFYELLQ